MQLAASKAAGLCRRRVWVCFGCKEQPSNFCEPRLAQEGQRKKVDNAYKIDLPTKDTHRYNLLFARSSRRKARLLLRSPAAFKDEALQNRLLKRLDCIRPSGSGKSALPIVCVCVCLCRFLKIRQQFKKKKKNENENENEKRRGGRGRAPGQLRAVRWKLQL